VLAVFPVEAVDGLVDGTYPLRPEGVFEEGILDRGIGDRSRRTTPVAR
jgi:hypothetical protein